MPEEKVWYTRSKQIGMAFILCSFIHPNRADSFVVPEPFFQCSGINLRIVSVARMNFVAFTRFIKAKQKIRSVQGDSDLIG